MILTVLFFRKSTIGWAVAQSPILGTTIKVSLLKRKGYVPQGNRIIIV